MRSKKGDDRKLLATVRWMLFRERIKGKEKIECDNNLRTIVTSYATKIYHRVSFINGNMKPKRFNREFIPTVSKSAEGIRDLEQIYY